MNPSTPDAKIDHILRPGDTPGVGEALLDAHKPGESDVARFLAKWLDSFLRIPGTNFKIGLDPILSLFPGIGSTLASGGGGVILVEAMRAGISLPVLLRMGGNMLLNTLFDYLPGIGPIASAFFKSNLRNLTLLRRWQSGQHEAVRRGTARLWLALVLILLLLALMIGGLFAGYVYLLRTVFGVGV